MSDKKNFHPDKLKLVKFQMSKGQVDSPSDFDITDIAQYKINQRFEIALDMDRSMIKTECTFDIATLSKGQNIKEAEGNFNLVFIYRVTDLSIMARPNKDTSLIDIDEDLAHSLAAISYSTSRGVLIAKLQGTALQNFLLPIIDTGKLLSASTKKAKGYK